MATAQLQQQSPAQTMMDQIIAMQPRLRERAEQTRTDRKVAQATVDELQDMGFFLSLQPKQYGGLELSPQEFFAMQMAIAEGCMSSAWACGMTGPNRMSGAKTLTPASHLLTPQWVKSNLLKVALSSVVVGVGLAAVITVVGYCWAVLSPVKATVHF